MEKIKLALMAILAVLLLVQIVDRSRETHQLAEIARRLEAKAAPAGDDRVSTQIADLSQAVRELAARGVASSSTHPQQAGTDEDPAARDGLVKLGVNFLLPYDDSYWKAELAGGTFHIFDQTPKGLNLLLEASATTRDVHKMISDRLCTYDPKDPTRWRARLAESVVISEDYTVYTIRIRKGVFWQRPRLAREAKYAWLDRDVELTAGDFAFYLELVQNPDVEAPHVKTGWEDLDHAEVVDPYTLKVVWKRRVYISVEQTLFELWPMPRHIYAKDAGGGDIPREKIGIVFNHHWFDEARQAVGVGAYVLTAYEPDKEVRFDRNPKAWNHGMYFDSEVWDCATRQDDAKLVAFKNNQADLMPLPPRHYKSEILDRNEPRFAPLDPADPKAGRKGPFGWERVKSNVYSYIGWNMRTPFFSDKRVRQAMTCAFPRQRVIDEVYFGLGQPIESDIHPDNPYCNKDLAPFPFDLDRSRALLQDAGWTDSDGDGWLDKEIDGVRRPFRFSVKYYANSAEWDRTLLIFRDELKKIGVDMQPLPFEWKELLRIYEQRDFDATVGAWGNESLEIDFFQLWSSAQADLPDSSNHCAYRNPKVDELAERLRVTFTFAERKQIADEVQAILHEDQPYTFFRTYEGIVVWQNLPIGATDRRPTLDGLTQSYDECHPLFRNLKHAHFRKP